MLNCFNTLGKLVFVTLFTKIFIFFLYPDQVRRGLADEPVLVRRAHRRRPGRRLPDGLRRRQDRLRVCADPVHRPQEALRRELQSAAVRARQTVRQVQFLFITMTQFAISKTVSVNNRLLAVSRSIR